VVERVVAAAAEFHEEDVGEPVASGGQELAGFSEIAAQDTVEKFGVRLPGEFEFGISREEPAGRDAGALRLGEIEGDFPARGVAERVPREDGVERPAELGREPAEEEKGGGSRAGGVGDRDVLDLAERGEGGGVVEETGEGKAGAEQAGPVQVAEEGPGISEGADPADQRELRGGIGPRLAVVDEAVNPAPEL